MQELTIGRDGHLNVLKISSNGKSVNGEPVPRSVSRTHCKLILKDDGTATIVNINPNNVTFVNGIPIQKKDIYGNDTVELGGDRYKLNLAPFRLAKVADISHLKDIWYTYKNEQERQRISSIRKNALRSITGLFSIGAIVISFIRPDDPGQQNTIEMFRYILYGLAVTTIAWTAISTFINAPKQVKKENEMRQGFQDEYVCPICNMFFGFDYRFEKLVSTGHCTRCNTKFMNQR